MEAIEINLVIDIKLQVVLKRMYEFSTDITTKEAILNLLTLKVDEKSINYLGIAEEDNTKISYLPPSKIKSLHPTERWLSSKRTMAKPSKVLKSICKDIGDDTLEKFASYYKMQTSICNECLDTTEVIIVEGEDIQRYYLQTNYCEVYDKNEGESPLWQSCMRYEHCQEYLELYSRNKDVNMAVFLIDGLVSCRCLLWKCGDKTYYDRIYAISSSVNRHMQACLEKMKFINISYKNICRPNLSIDVVIKLQYGQHELEYFPYADTMNQLTGKYLTNTTGEVELNSTEGDHSGKQSSICDCCDEEAEDLEEIGRGPGRHSSVCEYCRIFSEYYDEHILEGHSFDTDYDGVILYSDKIVLHDGETCHMDNSMLLENNTYCHLEEDWKMSVEGHKFIDEKNYIEVNGLWYTLENEPKLVEYA